MRDRGFQEYWSGELWHRPFFDLSGIRFFPLLASGGRKVTPVKWHIEAADPLVLCRMETHDFGAATEKDYMPIIESLRRDGWSADIMEGAFKYIHVDDLEKTEGPPPDGPF